MKKDVYICDLCNGVISPEKPPRPTICGNSGITLNCACPSCAEHIARGHGSGYYFEGYKPIAPSVGGLMSGLIGGSIFFEDSPPKKHTLHASGNHSGNPVSVQIDVLKGGRRADLCTACAATVVKASFVDPSWIWRAE